MATKLEELEERREALDANERNALETAERLESEKGIPKDITVDRMFGVEGWRERELEYMATQTGTPPEDVARIVEEGGQQGEEAEERYASGLAEARSMLLNKAQGTGSFARPETEDEPVSPGAPVGVEYPEGAVVLDDGSFITDIQAESFEAADPELYRVLTEDGVEAYREALRVQNVEINNQNFIRQQELKRSTKLPDDKYIDTIELNKIKAEDPEMYRRLTEYGLERANDWAEWRQGRFDWFIKQHDKLPDGEFINKTGLAYLEQTNPAAAGELKDGGFKGYEEALTEAYRVLEPYKSLRYPPTGEYELTRAMLKRDPAINKAAELLFSPETLESVYKTHRWLRPESDIQPTGKDYEKIEAAPVVTRILGVKVSPELSSAMALAGGVAIAEPTPIGELILLSVLGSIALYSAYKASKGELVIPSVIETAKNFEATNGRPIAATDIDANRAIPSVLPFQLTPGMENELRLKPSPLAKERATPIETFPIKTELNTAPPPSPATPLKQLNQDTAAEGNRPLDIASGPPPTSINPPAVGPGGGYWVADTGGGVAVADGVGIASGAAAAAGLDIDRLIGDALDKDAWNQYQEYRAYHPPKESLAALDRAVQEAAQTGEIDRATTKAYQEARRRYLEKLGILDEELNKWMGGSNPQFKNLSKTDLALIAGVFKATFVESSSKGATFNQAINKAALQANTRLTDLTKSTTSAKTGTTTGAAVNESTSAKTGIKTSAATSAAASESTSAQAKAAQAAETGTQSSPGEGADTTGERTGTTPRTRTAVNERTDARTRTKPIPRPLPFPGPTSTEDEKRKYIEAQSGATGWVQGQLLQDDGKKELVYHIVTEPYSEATHLVITGKPPNNVIIADNSKSAYETIRQIEGKPPTSPVKLEGGIADPVISSRKGKAVISFTPDKPRRTRGREPFPGVRERGKGKNRIRRVKL